jgi:hypothetical protein
VITQNLGLVMYRRGFRYKTAKLANITGFENYPFDQNVKSVNIVVKGGKKRLCLKNNDTAKLEAV